MLTIRKEQVEKFEKFIEGNFKINTIKRLREKYPQETNGLDDKQMMDFVKNGIEKAEKQRITERKDVYVYLQYLLVYKENFESNPDFDWAFGVFRVENLSGEEKILRLLKRNPI